MKDENVLHKPDAKNTIDNMLDLLYHMKQRSQDVLNALEHAGGTHTLDDIVHMVMAGRLLWWVMPNSFCVTEITEYPRQKHINIFLAGGDLAELLDIQEHIAEYGRACGCDKMVMAGRPGWLKPLKTVGWTPAYSAMQRDL